MMARIEPAKGCFVRLCSGVFFAASTFAASPALPQGLAGLRDGFPADARRSLSVQDADDDAAGAEGFRSIYVTQSPGSWAQEEVSTPDAFAVADQSAGSPPDPTTSVGRAAAQAGLPVASDDAETDGDAEPETTGAVRIESVGRTAAAEPLNLRVEAIESGDRESETDPFAPLGLRVGTFIVMPSLEQGLAWTSNASSSPNGSEAVLSETTLRLDALSDWSRHSAVVSAYGTFRKSISGEDISDPEGGVDAEMILDLADDFRLTAGGGYQLRPESATSPVDLPPTTSRPLRHTLTGSVGLERDVGLLSFGVTGNVERQQFGDADLQGGGELSQRERNFVLTTAVLRTGYQLSPALTPFVEGEVGRRIYDVAVDSGGYDRSATRLGARAGLELDLGEKLFGEVSAGWLREDLDDARLSSISASTINADLYWSPLRGTQVGLHAATIVEGTTAAGESGSILYNGRLTLQRQMRANLTGTAAVGAEWRDYAGSDAYDLTLSVEAGMTYWLNRYAGLTGRVRHETVKSDDSGRESKTNSVFVGLKLQR